MINEVGALRAATRAGTPHRDAKLASLIGEVLLDPSPGKHDHANRQCCEHGVIAFKWRGLVMPGPIRLKRNLRYFPVVGPGGGDAFCTLRATTVQQHHFGVLGTDLIKPIPDRHVVVEIQPAGEGDLRARWH